MREELKDSYENGCLFPLLCFLVLILVVVGIGTGFFERVLGVGSGSDKVVETVTYRKEDTLHLSTSVLKVSYQRTLKV